VGQQVFLDASDQVKAMWAEMSVDGYVARLTLAGNGDIGVEIVPTTLNADRLPVLATGEVFKRISERLTRLSVGQGAVVTEERGVLCVRPV
jgi:poly-gamma-glutamate synthesis protein (capsule biosynthesis protein)